jgi:tetratricopeptide (TPR) repeat protein
MGKLQPAQKAAEQALVLAQHSQSIEREAEARLILGEVTILQGSYELAQDHLDQAYDLSCKSSEKKNLARALNQRGMLHYRRSEYPLAAEYARQAVKSTGKPATA